MLNVEKKMWTPFDRDLITFELQKTVEKTREIDFEIMQLKRIKASIMSKFFFTDFDRIEIARIDARIAELEYVREELKRKAEDLRHLLSRYR